MSRRGREVLSQLQSDSPPCPLQIPGKQLFALVKRYLCVTSLLDKLSGGEEQSEEWQASSRVKQEFEFSMAMANLIVELVRVMGWDHSHKPEPPSQQETKPRTARPIFQRQPTSSSAAPAAPAPPPNEPSTFKTRSAFPSRSSYVEYVQANLAHGMRVRMLEDYEQVSAGDEGEFRQSNDGTPPVQVSAAGRMGLCRDTVWCGKYGALCGSSGACRAFPQSCVVLAFLCRCTGMPQDAHTGFTGTWWRSLAFLGRRSMRDERRCLP